MTTSRSQERMNPLKKLGMRRSNDFFQLGENNPKPGTTGPTTSRARVSKIFRRNRKILRNSNNLRFKSLYQAPEPIVVVLFIVTVTIITLVLTESWPF